jgi:hypothetical protein
MVRLSSLRIQNTCQFCKPETITADTCSLCGPNQVLLHILTHILFLFCDVQVLPCSVYLAALGSGAASSRGVSWHGRSEAVHGRSEAVHRVWTLVVYELYSVCCYGSYVWTMCMDFGLCVYGIWLFVMYMMCMAKLVMYIVLLWILLYATNVGCELYLLLPIYCLFSVGNNKNQIKKKN